MPNSERPNTLHVMPDMESLQRCEPWSGAVVWLRGFYRSGVPDEAASACGMVCRSSCLTIAYPYIHRICAICSKKQPPCRFSRG